MRRIHCVTRGTGSWSAAAAVAALLLVPLSEARAEPLVSVVGGAGVPGSSVAVTVSLSNDTDNAGVSLGVHLRYDDTLLTVTPPVTSACTIADRLKDTHEVAGRIITPGLVDVEVLVSGVPNPPPTLGDGDVVSCDFGIDAGVPAGTTSAIDIEAPLLGDDMGTEIPVQVSNGQVQVIAEPPSATPTVTNTPVSTPTVTPTHNNTPTATNTVPGTPTATASQTPTDTPGTVPPTKTATASATRTNTAQTPSATATITSTASATATKTGGTATPTQKKSGGGGGGCNVVTPDGSGDISGTLALLLAPALLIWTRRRRA